MGVAIGFIKRSFYLIACAIADPFGIFITYAIGLFILFADGPSGFNDYIGEFWTKVRTLWKLRLHYFKTGVMGDIHSLFEE